MNNLQMKKVFILNSVCFFTYKKFLHTNVPKVQFIGVLQPLEVYFIRKKGLHDMDYHNFCIC